MKNMAGFTLIELVMFIVVSGLVVSAVLMTLSLGTRTMPAIQQQINAMQIAQRCMEWFIGQRKINGYAVLTCPNTSTPAFCTAPSGYTVTTDIACTTVAGDANYKTITVTVTGPGSAALTTLIGDY